MSLKKRFLNLITSLVMIFGSAPLTIVGQASAADASLNAPTTAKKLIDNNDGTYTIALSVTGETSSNTTTNVTKANVVLVLDTSGSMNGGTGSGSQTRLQAEKNALTKDNGIIDNLLRQNVSGDSIKSDIIEVAIVNFGTRGTTAQTWTTDGDTLKSTINGLTTSTGTNWEEALSAAKSLADQKKTSQPNEDTYIIFMTDGEPTTHSGSYNVNTRYAQEWGYANDDARSIVTAGYKFYALFTWGSGNSSHYLSSLVQYAYTGTGDSNSTLSSAYEQYFTDATDTETLITTLTQIVNDITTGVGYTNVEMTDGVTTMTASSVKATAGGDVTGLKYYRSGGSYGTADIDNGNYGTEWTEAPHATINEKGEVDWDLGSAVLEDGVTYTVTFVVWPKQDSLDLVADLNNGKKSYENLTNEQKSQIAVNNGHYTLKTNTDYPTVTYSTVTTTTTSTGTTSVVSDPVTINLTNPSPVSLAEKTLAVEKKWDDTMDPTQREEVKSVVLKLKIDGKYYDFNDDSEEIDGITLKEGTDGKWTAGSINVAPGVMISNPNNPAYDASKVFTYNDKSYSILEEGHDYVFSEENINNHFELTAYEHHPMLVDGQVKSVTFTRDAEGNITGISDIYEIDTLSATNTIKGGINIQKKIVDENGTEITESTDKFTAVAHLVDEDGGDYSYDYRIYYGTNNPEYNVPERTCTNQDGTQTVETNKHRSCHIYGSGTITQELYVGDTIRVVNVNAGTKYYVEETNVPLGYEVEGIDSQISVGSANNFGSYTDAQVDNSGEKTQYIMQGNSAWQTIITNKYTFGSLKISKTVEGNPAQAKSFIFTVKLYDKTGAELTDGTYNYTGSKTGTIKSGETVELADGENITIAGLPEGARYEVTEEEMAGYTTSKTGDTGTIVKNEISEASFKNTYRLTPVTTTIKVYKGFDNFWLTGDEFAFNLEPNGTSKNGKDAPLPFQTYRVVTGALTPAEFTIDITEADEYYYVVTEPKTDILNTNWRGGITRVDRDTDVYVTITAVDNGDGTLTVTTKYSKNQSEVTGEDVKINNTYDAEGDFGEDPTVCETGVTVCEQIVAPLTFRKIIRDIDDNTVTLKDSYNFELVPITPNAPMPEGNGNVATSDATTGVFKFGNIHFTYADLNKTFEYKVIETSELPKDGVSNTITKEIHISVKVIDGNDGKLRFVIMNEDEYTQTFENRYTTEPTPEEEFIDGISAKLSKTVIDKTNSYTDQTFTFEIFGENNEITATATPEKNKEVDGKITVSGIEPQGLSFTKPGTYTFTVREALPFPCPHGEPDCVVNGMSYDMTEYTLTVVVEDDGKGELHITNIKVDGDSSKEMSFTNVYEAAPTSLAFYIQKNLEGTNEGVEIVDFSFEMTGDATANATVRGDSLSDGTETVSLKTVEFTEAGTYNYVIKENNDGAAGYGYDQTVYNIEVDVVDENGQLVVKINDETVSEYTAEFDNTYSVEELTIEIETLVEMTKSLTGRDLNDEEFTFAVYDEEGVEVATGANDAEGKISFNKSLTFAEPGTCTFTVKEDSGNLGGVSYDENEYTFTVVVIDNGEGELEIDKTNSSLEAITFTNTYEAASTTEKLVVSKLFNGWDDFARNDEFTFEISSENADGFEIKSETTATLSDVSRTAEFEIEFNKAGTYTFVIAENESEEISLGNILNKTGRISATVTVTDNLNGKLEATISYADEVSEIENYYAEGSNEIEFTKVLEGRDWQDDDAFEIELYQDGELVDTQIATKDEQTVSFALDFKLSDVQDEPYEYTVKEKYAGETIDGVSYDENEYKVSVVVSDNGDGSINATISYDDGQELTNVYSAESVTIGGDTETPIIVTKTITGETENLSDYPTFTFMLEQVVEDGEEAEFETLIEVIRGEGTVSFGELTFTETGTYTFKVTEVDDQAENWNYDKTEYLITVEITDNLKGQLEAEVTSEEIEFMNMYHEPGRGEEEVPYTYDAGIGFYIILAIFAMFGIGVSVLNLTKNEEYDRIVAHEQEIRR